MDARRSRELLDPLFTTEKMRAIFSDHGQLQAMLDFEAALARAAARAGAIPHAAGAAIAAHCRSERFDVRGLAAAAAQSGNTVIPLVRALTALVGKSDTEAARYVHWGATSQDAMDTGVVLQLREALAVFDGDLGRLSSGLAALAEQHAATPLAGRTWLQQGPPVTLGLKAAGFLSAVERHRVRLGEARSRAIVLQFGGAVGTLAALGSHAAAVANALGEELELPVPDVPWHAQRDRVAEIATALGLMVGTLGKLARDVSLLMQTEVGEATEASAPGRGGSSTMPHKRNPIGCAAILAAATRVPALVSVMLAAMVQEHERGLGGWHAEWETLPEICTLAAGALAQTIAVVEGLHVDAQRMSTNLDLTHGLILAEAVSMALAAKLGKREAHAVVEEASARAASERRSLRDALAADARVTAQLSAAELDRLLDPRHYLGESQRLVARALAARRG
ncbi:MAG TPA: 3-carboxy-cis,cis-muconate cycloisomerase [Casimicrobiaceae bacterium]|nr:3-carboxy-cis,cis-muconate cycloisomerase [Casimicrobiaceae bacterium]